MLFYQPQILKKGEAMENKKNFTFEKEICIINGVSIIAKKKGDIFDTTIHNVEAVEMIIKEALEKAFKLNKHAKYFVTGRYNE